MKKINFKLNFWLAIFLGAAILAGLAAGLITLVKADNLLSAKIAEAEEAARPANLDIIILKTKDCEDCFDPVVMLEEIKKQNVKIVSEREVEVDSVEGKELISRFNIAKIPTFVISGEINKNAGLKDLWPQIGEAQEDSFVLRQVGAPYLEVVSGEVRGRGELIMLADSNCDKCYDVAAHQLILRQFGFNQLGEVIDAGSDKGKELVKKYNVLLLPTIILTGDLDVYPSLKSVWPQVGTVEDDGVYVFRKGVLQMGVYKDLSSGKIIDPSKEPNSSS